MRIVVTGATGQFGRLVVEALLRRGVAPGDVVATGRAVERLDDLAARGVQVRRADYDDPATLDAALAGADRALLVSASEPGRRAPQHAAFVAAARTAGVQLLAYTSVLHADTSPMLLAEDHLATERALEASGVPFVVLRNGWYVENATATLPVALATGAFASADGQGLTHGATRADYAEAAAVVLTSDGHAGRRYELAGDTGYTQDDLAAAVSAALGREIGSVHLDEDAYRAALVGAGLPGPVARVFADSSARTAEGWLADGSRTLSTLIGRPTTPLAEAVRTAVAGLEAGA